MRVEIFSMSNVCKKYLHVKRV